MPGSPESSTTRPSPALACVQRRSNRSISSSRPMSAAAGERKASKRLISPLSANTCQICCRSAKPAIARSPRSSRSNRPPSCCRVLSAMTSLPGSAETLQPGRQIRCLADDAAFLRLASADQVANHHQPACNTNSHRERPWNFQPAHCLNRSQPSAHRSLPHRPHVPGDSRNRLARHRPYISQRSHRTVRWSPQHSDDNGR